ncbi:hypothetical protein TNCV_2769681 [Trichonephila clavipes]|nr:hypothetical protein TNCV_2769681 [Trichonephila clavipes]
MNRVPFHLLFILTLPLGSRFPFESTYEGGVGSSTLPVESRFPFEAKYAKSVKRLHVGSRFLYEAKAERKFFIPPQSDEGSNEILDRSNEKQRSPKNNLTRGSNEMLDKSNDMLDRSNDMLDRSNDMLDQFYEIFGEKPSHLGDEVPILVYEWTRKKGELSPIFGLEDCC